jgi:hypothetical protein
MKNILKTATLLLTVCSISAFAAEKIVITGAPIVLQKQGDLYLVPENYKATQNYTYVDIEGTKRACFLDKKPDLTNIDVVSINVQIGSEKATWNCYATDPTYFVIEQ